MGEWVIPESTGTTGHFTVTRGGGDAAYADTPPKAIMMAVAGLINVFMVVG